MSKTLWMIFAGVAVIILGVSITLIILVNTNNDKPYLKLDELNLELSQSFAIRNLVNDTNCTINSETPILSISEDAITAIDYGETILTFTYDNDTLTLPVTVTVDNLSFSTSKIVLYTNGKNEESLTLLSDNKVIHNLDFNFDSNIIDYDGNVVVGKSVGSTTITIANIDNLTSPVCEVEVKQYGYAINVDESTILLNVNQTRTLDAVTYGQGEKVLTDYYVDSEYLKLEDDKITALKVGDTEIIINTETSYNVHATYTINVHIEKTLQIEKVSVKRDEEPITTIYYGMNALGNYPEYTMEIVYNKSNCQLYTIEGIQLINQIKNGTTYTINFQKLDNAPIKIYAVDLNDNQTISYLYDIPLSEFRTEIIYNITDALGNETDTLYEYNTTYQTQAEEDGFYNECQITTEDNISIYADEEYISYQQGIIKAVKEGQGTITLKALDGTELEQNIPITIQRIKAEALTVTVGDIKVGDTIAPEIILEPIYCITNIEYEYNSNYIDENLLCLQEGTTDFTIKDTISGLTQTLQLTIKSQYSKIIYNNVAVTEITMSVNDAENIEITDSIYFNVLYEEDGELKSESNYVSISHLWANYWTINTLNVGHTTIKFYQNDILVAYLDIYVV